MGCAAQESPTQCLLLPSYWEEYWEYWEPADILPSGCCPGRLLRHSTGSTGSEGRELGGNHGENWGKNFTGGNPCPQQGRTRDEALEAAGPVSESGTAARQHPRICLQTGFRKERRVPPPQGRRAAVPGGDLTLPWATISPSVRPPPSAPRPEGESAAAADLCGSAGFSPRAGTHRLCLRALSPRPRGGE